MEIDLERTKGNLSSFKEELLYAYLPCLLLNPQASSTPFKMYIMLSCSLSVAPPSPLNWPTVDKSTGSVIAWSRVDLPKRSVDH
jgi:hypothetical protein